MMPRALRAILERRITTKDLSILNGFDPIERPSQQRRILFVACFSEVDTPSGGHKVLYRNVDVLRAQGLDAYVLHCEPGFRYTWFANTTKVTYLTPGVISYRDILVIPETLGCAAASLSPGVKKVIFNQNCYYTFDSHPLETIDRRTPYLHPDVMATIVVSEDSVQYLRHAFDSIQLYRVRPSISTTLFRPLEPKRKLIACMPRKGRQDLLQIVNILKFRGVFAKYGFDLRELDGCSELETAAGLGESLFFLATSPSEGFGLPAAEAMACGCVVVGYTGQGGREFMQPGHSFPISNGDVLGFARKVEELVALYAACPQTLLDASRAATRFIETSYSPGQETRDILSTWDSILRGSGVLDWRDRKA